MSAGVRDLVTAHSHATPRSGCHARTCCHVTGTAYDSTESLRSFIVARAGGRLQELCKRRRFPSGAASRCCFCDTVQAPVSLRTDGVNWRFHVVRLIYRLHQFAHNFAAHLHAFGLEPTVRVIGSHPKHGNEVAPHA